jgi:hypothetical protein
LLIIAFVGLGTSTKAFAFRRDGHWVFVDQLQRAFHISGSSMQADEKTGEFDKALGIHGVSASNSDVYGYSDNGVIDVYRASDLVEGARLNDSPKEQPLALPVEPPVLVYRDAGIIRRLTTLHPPTIDVGTPISQAVAEPGGTIWISGAQDGRLCYVSPDSSLPSCRGKMPSPVSRLVLVDGSPVVVNTTSAQPLSKSGLGSPVALPVHLPDNAQIATTNTGGQVVALNPNNSNLLIFGVTASTAGNGKAIKIEPKAKYQTPQVTDNTVVLVPQASGSIVSVNKQTGEQLHSKGPVSGATATSEPDGRVYVDTKAGSTIVVDQDGAIHPPIDLIKTTVPGPPPKPKTGPPSNPTQTHQSTNSASGSTPKSHGKPKPPGLPLNVLATAGNAVANVTWSPPQANGTAIGSYRVDVQVSNGAPKVGPISLKGNATSVDVNGLQNGATYTFVVTAHTTAGDGPSATSNAVTPSADTPDAPSSVTLTATPGAASAPAAAQLDATWPAANGQGHSIKGYAVTVSGSDGSRKTKLTTATSISFTAADGLAYGPTYTAVVRAQSDTNHISKATTSNSQVFWRPADPPINVVANPGDQQVALSWTTPNLNGGTLTNFVVQGASPIGTRTVAGNSLTVTGLSNGTAYTFNIVAMTSANNSNPVSGSSAQVQQTPGRAPDIGGLSANLSGDRQAAVNWTVDDQSSGPVTCRVYFDGSERWNGPCNGPSAVTIGGLAYSHTYDVYATAQNSYGGPTTSNHANVTTNNPPPTVGLSIGGYAKPCTTNPSSACYWLVVSTSNFSPGTVRVDCYDDTSSSRYYTYTTSANSTSQVCFHAKDRHWVWAIVNGVQSPHVQWN